MDGCYGEAHAHDQRNSDMLHTMLEETAAIYARRSMWMMNLGILLTSLYTAFTGASVPDNTSGNPSKLVGILSPLCLALGGCCTVVLGIQRGMDYTMSITMCSNSAHAYRSLSQSITTPLALNRNMRVSYENLSLAVFRAWDVACEGRPAVDVSVLKNHRLSDASELENIATPTRMGSISNNNNISAVATGT